MPFSALRLPETRPGKKTRLTTRLRQDTEMTNGTSGTNYRLNFWLRPDADLEDIVNALKHHCAEQEPEQPYQPNITIIGRIGDQLLSEVDKMPGVSGSPHY